MKQKQILLWGAIAAGAAGLYLWYRARSSGAAWGLRPPGNPLPGGTGAQAPGPLPPPAGNGSTPAPGSTINSPAIVAARGAQTGTGSQRACNAAGGRFIKTIDAPYYGLCVSQANFDRWNATNPPDNATTARVRQVLGPGQLF